ncbi:hypothetical protein SAMN04515668_1186 [Hymenobacter arizonensis]|uniref:Uncharacterized protein n=1 Tax=Hymenobacter arizonensis TaxID=1227077 RepID=A0A1I5V5L3_HYMAR|nr:hypothetical protein SAMN04515668_1186 [Hymenobacter arizonensis]
MLSLRSIFSRFNDSSRGDKVLASCLSMTDDWVTTPREMLAYGDLRFGST